MQKHSLIICSMAAVAALLATPAAIAQEKKSKPSAPAGRKAAPSENGVAHYDAILKKYVDVKSGHIAYGALKASKTDMAALKKFMDWQATADVKAMAMAFPACVAPTTGA